MGWEDSLKSPYAKASVDRTPKGGLPPEAREERRVVGPGRVELPTSRLSGVRSNHLSYEPDEV